MPALSFSGEPERGPFWKLIISGEKEQTVRKPRKRPIKEGDLLKLYWKQRVPQDQKPIHYIGSAICTQIETLPKYAFMHSEAFARKDGFEDEGELLDWFGEDKEEEEFNVIHFRLIRNCWGCSWASRLGGIWVCGQGKGRYANIEPFSDKDPGYMGCYEIQNTNGSADK